jgi:hypothetical protein
MANRIKREPKNAPTTKEDAMKRSKATTMYTVSMQVEAPATMTPEQIEAVIADALDADQAVFDSLDVTMIFAKEG